MNAAIFEMNTVLKPKCGHLISGRRVQSPWLSNPRFLDKQMQAFPYLQNSFLAFQSPEQCNDSWKWVKFNDPEFNSNLMQFI